jgi:peptide-methionine (S)-S-oxide reductase
MEVPMKTKMILKALSLSLLIMLFGLAGNGSSHAAAGAEKATFAGGCFWSMTIPFEGLDGVVSVTAGYTGGHKKNPTYEEVETGTTGHAESVEVVYDPSKITYTRLLDVFWHNIDPTVRNRQFCDAGEQYRSAIFYHNEEQKRLAEESKKAIERSGVLGKHGTIYTQIVPATPFYKAEEYHQNFHRKNPDQYLAYRLGCGRDRRLKEIWGSQAGTHE